MKLIQSDLPCKVRVVGVQKKKKKKLPKTNKNNQQKQNCFPKSTNKENPTVDLRKSYSYFKKQQQQRTEPFALSDKAALAC